jgi:sulfatase modifying factor 1
MMEKLSLPASFATLACLWFATSSLSAAEEITPRHLKMKFVKIPAGEFRMGSTQADLELAQKLFPTNKGMGPDECPAHAVRITRPFYIGKFEVTVGEFKQFVNATGYKTTAEISGKTSFRTEYGAYRYRDVGANWKNTGFEQSPLHPVVNVSWDDAKAFCKWLSNVERDTYRLPTEAEWEYVARAGSTSIFPTGDDPADMTQYANFADASYFRHNPIPGVSKDYSDGVVTTAEVGSFKANAFGIHDMIGNAWELCEDNHDVKAYSHRAGIVSDPLVANGSLNYVLRGGCWGLSLAAGRYADRSGTQHDSPDAWIGFRVVRVIEDYGPDPFAGSKSADLLRRQLIK